MMVVVAVDMCGEAGVAVGRGRVGSGEVMVGGLMLRR